MAKATAIVQGREAFVQQKWKEAYRLLSAADRQSPLEPTDLERFATAAYLVGKDAHAVATWTRAHNDLIDQGHVERAARWGFWLSLYMLLAGETAQATGWLARSQRLLKGRGEACAEEGHGLIVAGLLEMGKGNTRTAGTSFEEAVALAERFGDTDLLALGLLSRGECLIRSQKNAEGVVRLDEAMLAVTAGEVSPVLTGIIYCAVILTCQHIFDLRRAREWTKQLDSWCASQPDLVPYRGQCLVHRSEILQSQGDWARALAEVRKARAHLAHRSEAVVGRACYQQGELHRLRGEFARANEMYREAGLNGHECQPGMSLLRLAEGKPDAAAALMRSGLDSAGGLQIPGAELERAKLLGPYVEILIANGDLVTARAVADELTQIATTIDAPFLLAISTQATGAALLAEGKMKAALALLREAWAFWRKLEVPYESARVRVLIGRVCQQLGDLETAHMHFHAASSVFERLGAAPDLVALERLTVARRAGPPGALTDREREVLLLMASGETNRHIATTLGISEHTVARHVSNIFDKLGVKSRTAASAFAHKHKLL